MKKMLSLLVASLLLFTVAAQAVTMGDTFEYAGSVYVVSAVHFGRDVMPIGGKAVSDTCLQIDLTCVDDDLTYGTLRAFLPSLVDANGTSYDTDNINGTFAEEASLSDLDGVKMNPTFTLQYDVPADIAPEVCTFELSGLAKYSVGTAIEDAAQKSTAKDGLIVALLDAVGEEEYYELFEYLSEGNTAGKGAAKAQGKALQKLLVALGAKISVDGSVGNKTITALHDTQDKLGLEQTDALDASAFADMIKCLHLKQVVSDESVTDLLKDKINDDEYWYLRGCAYVSLDKYASARACFERSEYRDADARADACVLSFPKNGELWHNSSYRSSKVKLTFKVADMTEGYASMYKIYAQNGDLVAALFVNGAGKASVNLPAGTYTIKEGYGREWYGLGDAFGSKGSYSTMLFDGGNDTVKLKSNYNYTLTVNTGSLQSGSNAVGSTNEAYSDF